MLSGVVYAADTTGAPRVASSTCPASRIGGGSFTEIEPAFSLRELEDLRLAMNRMSDQLMRSDQSQKNTDLGPVRVVEVIEDCLDRLNGLAVQKGISLVLAPFEQGIVAYGEEELLGKILENLLTNAIRYAKTTVTISVKAEKGQAAISVTDDGDGIDEKDLPHLFERCYKGRGGNFGIGLAIAHSAVEKMGGHLEAANQHGGGAVFRLFLKAL